MAWRLRRGRLPDAGGVHLRRHRGAPGLGTVLPGAGRADQRRRRRPHQPRGRHRPHRGGEVMILVAGGTGTLGTRLVRLLSDRGVEVRVLTRDPARAAHLPHTVQILTGDLREPAAVAAAVRGCSTVVSAVHGFVGPGKPSPESIDRDANLALIQAAATAGVEHLVLVSGLGVAADHPMSLYRAKFAAEQALRASGLRWTIIRPSAYLETWIGVTGAKLAGKGQARADQAHPTADAARDVGAGTAGRAVVRQAGPGRGHDEHRRHDRRRLRHPRPAPDRPSHHPPRPPDTAAVPAGAARRCQTPALTGVPKAGPPGS